jgi:hypothetical protein
VGHLLIYNQREDLAGETPIVEFRNKRIILEMLVVKYPIFHRLRFNSFLVDHEIMGSKIENTCLIHMDDINLCGVDNLDTTLSPHLENIFCEGRISTKHHLL